MEDKIAEWQKRGNFTRVLGHQLFYYDSSNGKSPLVVLHGYPTCSFDYHRVIPILETTFRVIVHDHPGFGLSEKPSEYSYTLIDQADRALALWRQLNIRGAHLLAHDYGTSVATELIARRATGGVTDEFTSATLGNGSMLIELSQLRPIQRILKHPVFGPLAAKLSTQRLFDRNMRKIWGNFASPDQSELDILWQLLIRQNGRQRLPIITRYIDQRYQFWHRWIGALSRTDLPIQLLWADEDTVAVVEMAYQLEKRIKNVHLDIINGVGHYPMLEAPEAYAESVMKYWNNRTV